MADTWDEIRALQEGVSEEEKEKWVRIGCTKNSDEIWESRDARPVLPDSLLSPMSRHIHGPPQIGRDAMMRVFMNYWYNPKFCTVAEEPCLRCVVCSQINLGRKTPVIMSHTGRSGRPFNQIQIDFVEMPWLNGLRYILVVVCIFSRWVEAYPMRRNDSLTVAKLLLRELIPRFGVPVSLESD